MNRIPRILVEIFGPPLLAAVIVDVVKLRQDGLIASLFGFPPFLMFAYLYAIVPSVVYAIAMEFWFRNCLHLRYGLLVTVSMSIILGLGAGFLIQWVVQGNNWSFLPPVGALVGFTLGLYLERRSRSDIVS